MFRGSTYVSATSIYIQIRRILTNYCTKCFYRGELEHCTPILNSIKCRQGKRCTRCITGTLFYFEDLINNATPVNIIAPAINVVAGQVSDKIGIANSVTKIGIKKPKRERSVAE